MPADAIGAQASTHFVLDSGHKLTDPILGFFTVNGFRDALLKTLPEATQRVLADSSGLTQTAQYSSDPTIRAQQIEHDVVALYARDYIAAWDGLLDHMDVVPPPNAPRAIYEFQMLTAPGGPIKSFLTAAVAQLSLTAPPSAAPVPGGKTVPPAVAPVVDAAAQAVGDHFSDLRKFVLSAQLDGALSEVSALQQQIFRQLVNNGAGGEATSGLDATMAVQQAAAGAPEPVARWLQTLARRGGTVRSDTLHAQAIAAYGGPDGALPLCQLVVEKFPFRAAAREDASMADFAGLFAPNGRFDTFFAQFLRPYVNTQTRDWTLRDAGGLSAPVGADSMAQFQRAAALRQTFFAFGGDQPMVSFSVRPVMLDAGARQVSLNLGGIDVIYEQNGPQPVTALTWPGPTRMSHVELTFDPPVAGGSLQENGPWALFRLLAQGRMRRSGTDAGWDWVISQGGRTAEFELSAATSHSPFGPQVFAGFRCPTVGR